MPIETFSSKNFDKDSDLERKMVEQDVVMPADIAAYADEIAERVEHLRKDSEKKTFVFDALTDDRMKRLAGTEELDDLTDAEIAHAMDRIRKALIESLRGKIDDSLFFVVKDLQVKSNDRGPDIISEVMAGGGKTGVHKQQPHFEGFKDLVDDAMAEFAKLPPHENIVKLLEHDPSGDESLWEKKHIKPLSKYMLNEKDSDQEKFRTGLTVVKDCMRGAVFLSEHGLVLQDIHPLNLGLEMTDKGPKGVLFDFGGLVIEGDMPAGNARMSRKGYWPPGIGTSGFHPSEMTYQFGKTLETLAQHYAAMLGTDAGETGVKDVKKLAMEMVAPDPKDRPPLEDATERLEAIMHWISL
jgi:hypothetical protein